MRGGYDYTPIPLSEASCIIAHLFAELALPCSCCNRENNDHLLTDPEERELRFRAQRSALRNCRKLIDNIEFAHENLPGVTDDAFAFWSRLAAGVKNQTAAWYKKDRERAAKLVTKT